MASLFHIGVARLLFHFVVGNNPVVQRLWFSVVEAHCQFGTLGLFLLSCTDFTERV
jgi:hypothetical protein